mgnify:CR=1 FL=1
MQESLKQYEQDKVKKEASIAEKNTQDDLTGLFNHRYLHMAIEKEISRASRYDLKFSLVFLDLDHFKQINDTHGHIVGDNILKRIAKLLCADLRSRDITARWGGEEFILLSSHTSADSAYRLGEKLRLAIASTVFKAEERPITVTTSIGIAKFESPEKFDHSLALADQQLYRAKNTGKNKVCF